MENKESRFLKELRFIATVQSIGSSTRIEGATLSDNEIEKLLKKVKITIYATRDEQEVIGYTETLEFIFENYADVQLTENNIKYLHGMLLKHSTKDKHHKGEYKKLSNKVVANYAGGVQKTIFKTTEPFLTPEAMRSAVNWANNTRKTNAMHPLIIIACFIYEFLSIHPFQDGNGRLSRLLTTLLLLRQGYAFIPYISFENYIELHRSNYYKVLMEAQQHRETSKEVITAWMLYFLSGLETLVQKLETKYLESGMGGYLLNSRQKRILQFIVKKQTVTVRMLDAAFADISRNTLKKDVQHLFKEGYIKRLGTGRSTHYIAA